MLMNIETWLALYKASQKAWYLARRQLVVMLFGQLCMNLMIKIELIIFRTFSDDNYFYLMLQIDWCYDITAQISHCTLPIYIFHR